MPAQVFSDPSFESFRAFHVDSGGMVPAHEGHDSRLPEAALAMSADRSFARSRMRRLGPRFRPAVPVG